LSVAEKVNLLRNDVHEYKVQLDKHKIQLRNEVNSIKKCKKLKWKAMQKQRKKNKKNFGKRKAIQATDTIPTKNIEIESEIESEMECSEDSSNNLNHTSHSNNEIDEINKICNGYNHNNPIKDSVQLLKWLLHPMDTNTFLE